MIEIKELIKQAHENAVEKGFYPEGEEKNIGELLMLIVSELGEALEAHRNNRFSDIKKYDEFFNAKFYSKDVKQKTLLREFESKIKDTFEDEIADVFIRLFDLCGYLGIEPVEKEINIADNIGLALLDMTTCLCMLGNGKKEDQQLWLDRAFSFLVHFSTRHNIPIQKHVTAKMAYNKTRPHKHGKEY